MARLNWHATVLSLILVLSFRASIVQADAILNSASNLVTNNSNQPHTVTIEVSENFFADPFGAVFGQLSANGSFSTGTGSIVITAYADDSNVLFGHGILLDTATDSLFPYTGPFVPFTATAPYSLTLKTVLTLNANSSALANATLRVSSSVSVPEPSAILLFASGTGLIWLVRRRRRRPRARGVPGSGA
jgi:hypothetical protein